MNLRLKAAEITLARALAFSEIGQLERRLRALEEAARDEGE